MKNKVFYLAAASIIICSCTDLDVDIKSKYTSFPDNPIAKQAVAEGCFNAHRGSFNNWYSGMAMMGSVTGGENLAVSLGTDYYDSGCRMRATLHNVLPDDYTIGWYADIMGGITQTNRALRDLNLLDEDSTKVYSAVGAQLRTIRAFYHWILMDGFGDTPILDRLFDEKTQIDRQPRAKVTTWIVGQLDTVMNFLPKETDLSTYGKPNFWMAKALLAKIYLNWNVYTADDVTTYEPGTPNPKLNNCIAVCDEIINSGRFNLNDDYKKKFLPNNGVEIKDFIYAVPYNASDKDNNVYGRYHTWRRGQNDGNGGPGLYNIVLSNSVGGCFTMNPDFSALFNLPGDRRNDCIYGNDKDGIVYRYGADYEKDYDGGPTFYKGDTVKFTQTVTLAVKTTDTGDTIPMGPAYEDLSVENTMTGWTQGWHSNKYILDPTEYNLYERNSSNDAAIFRYADILLMKAEAILRGKTAAEGDTPQSLFNQIRAASEAPTITNNPTLEDILDERGREFFDEGWRRNDMIRFGKFETPTWELGKINPNFSDKRKRIFPIPTTVLQSNTNWTQNPGY